MILFPQMSRMNHTVKCQYDFLQNPHCCVYPSDVTRIPLCTNSQYMNWRLEVQTLEHEPSPAESTTPEEKRLKVMAHGKIRPGFIPRSDYHAPNGIHRDSSTNHNPSFSLPSAEPTAVQTVNSLIDAWQTDRPGQGRGGGRPRKNKRIYV